MLSRTAHLLTKGIAILSVADSAAILRVSPSQVRALVSEGALPARRVGHAWILKEEDVLRRAASRPAPGRSTRWPAEKPNESTTPDLKGGEFLPGCRRFFLQRRHANSLIREFSDGLTALVHCLRERERVGQVDALSDGSMVHSRHAETNDAHQS